MRVCCLVKFVPDVNNFKYDYETNTIVRENVSIIINPDDSCALAYAFKLKQDNPDVYLEIVSMAPQSVKNHMRDYLRMGANQATIISDVKYAGSDSLVTSKIIHRYLNQNKYDLILTGTHSLDGDTSHVPNQIAQLLNLDYLGNIKSIDRCNHNIVNFSIENEDIINTYEATMPLVLGLSKTSKYKLPFVRFDDLKKEVDDKITIISNLDLNFNKEEIGLLGSPTKVVKTYVKELSKKEAVFVKNDEDGINVVYNFLKEKELI